MEITTHKQSVCLQNGYDYFLVEEIHKNQIES